MKTRDRLWTLLVYLYTTEQRPKNIIMIGKNWNNQYCYNGLILENSIKTTKIKIMRWETDKRWLYNDPMITQSLNTKLLSTRKPE